jgi:hypothetical protein
MSRNLQLESHGRFRRRRCSVLQQQDTDYHALYTMFMFQTGQLHATFNLALELFSKLNSVLYNNRRQVFFCNHLVQRVCLPPPSGSRPTCLRSLLN